MTISYAIDFQSLRALQTYVKSSAVSQQMNLHALLWRVEDFSQARSFLSTAFRDEYIAAHAELPRAKTAQELHTNLERHVLISSLRLSPQMKEFSSYTLSPAVRHFINDGCRVFESFATVLADKYPSLKHNKLTPVDVMLSVLLAGNQHVPFDAPYIIELYALWNKYQQLGASGISTTAWRYENNTMFQPTLYIPELSGQLPLLGSMAIDEFAVKTTDILLEFSKSLCEN